MAKRKEEKNLISSAKRISAWNREDTTPVKLCKGAVIPSAVYQISENRYHTLILKGLIVYLLTAGGFGCYLTAMEIDFNQLVFNVVILFTAVLCAMLYHSWRSENLGYLVFFIVYAMVLILFINYINSGFYAIVNDTLEWASIYFKTEGLQTYNERISNRYAAVTIAVSLIGVAVNILLNNYILRRARYMIAIMLTCTLNLFALYMEKEPSGIYAAMLIGGIVMTYCLKAGRHYSLNRTDHIFKRNNKGLEYGLDWHSLMHMIIIAALYVLMVVVIISALFDKTSYVVSRVRNPKKEASNEYVQNLMTLGIGGLFNFYDNTGGLASGKLGGVSSIHLDYNTDVTIEFTPYSMDTVYIKNFIGMTYSPYENIWKQPDNFYHTEEHNKNDADALEEAFDSGYKYSAKGIMKIKNVEGDIRPYLPYYTNNDVKILKRGEELTFTYYPREGPNKTEVPRYYVDNGYLKIPHQNEQVIREFCEEAGFGGSKEEIINQVIDYYQENIPYTIRPGATPWRQDFVNYFLTENKKGYCAHFASAAVLIFRYYGIPARYCEGYAVDYGQIIDKGELVEDADYKDYFSGYSELGETGLITVDATDADAHAWVEIYDETYGWQVVEVTPSSGVEEDDYSDFWDSFNSIFGDGDTNEASGNGIDAPNITDFHINDNLLKILGIIVGGLMGLGVLIFLGLRIAPVAKYYYKYNTSDDTDRLILSYSRLIRKLEKKDKTMKSKINYRTQVNHILKNYDTGDTRWDKDKLTDILERAGFSGKKSDGASIGYVRSFLDSIKKKNK